MTVATIVEDCTESAGPKPLLAMTEFDLSQRDCPDDMACLTMEQLSAIGRFIARSTRWIEQAEIACSGESDDQ